MEKKSATKAPANKEWKLHEMRLWSKTMMGSEHRLSVAVIARHVPDHEVYATGIARTLGVDDGEVGKQFDALTEAGLLEKGTRPYRTGHRGRPRQVVTRTDDAFWVCLEELSKRFRR